MTLLLCRPNSCGGLRCALLALPLFLAACSACPREACKALDEFADQNGPAVAGSIAIESDAITNGCADCPFGGARIEIWSTDSPTTTSEQATAITQSAGPTFDLFKDGTYRQALDAGHYLFCVRPSCISLEVTSNTVTVNIKRREGPTSFFTAPSSGDKLSETFGFEVGY